MRATLLAIRLRNGWEMLACYLAKTPGGRHIAAMLNILSILTGLVSLICVIPGVIPFLGWANWLAIPIAVVGLVIGMLSSKNTGRNLNLVILVIAIIRLSLGGGII
jgi:uncharacterized membrane protein YkvA (DUF1232 family)